MKETFLSWYRNVLRNPKYRWWIIGGSLLYLISPFDISPDFIPVVGWIDDGLVATLLVAELSDLLLTRLRGRKEGAEDTTTVTDGNTVDAQVVDVDPIAAK
ncbi:MAG TPA: DUF1232 domain-containing protein [Leptolyngbyaceae cyanobacterium M33_DOE_097]|uniref:DUF1232 domain-containing protein n=1 Tax=Oscillatoriales cyanobacterium SpSt-418 TaxID=2282169 RepID=A0A7C3KKD9_9CYAN|nr:DUF1232 domain-containing protein [Leptolyngbyaceae cyanobacterium M33_DOE_097]